MSLGMVDLNRAVSDGFFAVVARAEAFGFELNSLAVFERSGCVDARSYASAPTVFVVAEGPPGTRSASLNRGTEYSAEVGMLFGMPPLLKN